MKVKIIWKRKYTEPMVYLDNIEMEYYASSCRYVYKLDNYIFKIDSFMVPAKYKNLKCYNQGRSEIALYKRFKNKPEGKYLCPIIKHGIFSEWNYDRYWVIQPYVNCDLLPVSKYDSNVGKSIRRMGLTDHYQIGKYKNKFVCYDYGV